MPHSLDHKDIYETLINIANENGIVSSDEQNMLEKINEDIEKYFEVLDNSYEDDIITSEEQHKLYQMRKNILDSALAVAKEDDEVSQEEFALLQAVKSIIEALEENEHY